MTITAETRLISERLAAIPSVQVLRDVPLARYTRFGLGGPADVFAETSSTGGFAAAMRIVRESAVDHVVIGGGTNLVVSDEGFRGVVLRFSGARLEADGESVHAEAGAVLQALVDFTIERGLKGLETLAGIPGWVGAAVYGNAGAYGHSISECVTSVRFLDERGLREFENPECEFRYRESVFKQHKERIIVSVGLRLTRDDPAALRATADQILQVRNEKFPPALKCAGSIFKNFLLAELPAAAAAAVPPAVVREGKVPAGYFLEQVGAKGLRRGGIHVAGYHANLIYNDGSGTAGELCGLIGELQRRVRERFGIEAQEEVQYVGFGRPPL